MNKALKMRTQLISASLWRIDPIKQTLVFHLVALAVLNKNWLYEIIVNCTDWKDNWLKI